MRVLVFSTDDFLPPAGGAELALGEIIRHLPEVQFEVISAKIHRGPRPTNIPKNVTIRHIGWGFWPLLDKLLLVLLGPSIAYKSHKKAPFDLVWSMMASYSAFAARIFKKKAKTPYLLTLQEGDPITRPLYRILKRLGLFGPLFSDANALQPISHFLSRWGHFMGFKGPVEAIIPNGVDTDHFSREISAAEREKHRSSFGFPPDALILISVSRFVAKNGLADIIRALPLLPEKVCLVLCGFGDLDQSLRDLVARLDLEHRVHFFGSCSHTHLPAVLSATDIFIRPSLSEGLGNSFLEAMACSLPVIGTKVGGIPDFLEDGKTGFFCLPENPESIKDTVLKIINSNPARLTEIKKSAKDLVIKKYNWRLISSGMKNLFEKTQAITPLCLEKPLFILSLDVELAWGMKGSKRFFHQYEKKREVVDKLLQLFEKYDIPATWAVVGHLFLDSCAPVSGVKHPEIIRPKKEGTNDWFEIDPCTSITTHPFWYGKDIVGKIIKSEKQELACHTFSHVYMDFPSLTKDWFESELAECQRLAKDHGRSLTSFIFPQNKIRFVDSLAPHGFTAYRAPDDNWYSSLRGLLKRIAHVIDDYLCLPVRSVLPYKDNDLIAIPGSYFYVHKVGWARFLPVSFRVKKAKWGIDDAIETGKIFHLWTHPFNLTDKDGKLLAGLEEILRYVAEKRRQGKISITSMNKVNNFLKNNENSK
ncbi:MAG: glycosyltransferase [Candidatus Harrisonbacteria bacterium]|nr:glycosyltransferase [Candidatus Harrisonbacteria bacterium]